MLTISRDYSDEEWESLTEWLVARGLLTTDGGLSGEGRALKEDVEARTDRLALSAYEALSDDDVRRLIDLTTPVARAVVAAGDVGTLNPIGLGTLNPIGLGPPATGAPR